MAASSVEICNSALILVGAERINSITDENKRARLCLEQYDKLKKQLLANHPWNFALKRTELATTTAPIYEWSTAFVLPNDCLRVFETDLGDDVEWVVEGRLLLTNTSTIKIKYVSSLVTEGHFSEGFSEALAHKLSIYLAYNLTQSTTQAKSLKDDYKVALRDAKAQDAQEGSTTQVVASTWVNSRF